MFELNYILSKLGISSIRPLQRDVLKNVIAGVDTIACLPTSYGKSLCYQLPALLDAHLTIVVSPLIATINDQVDAINRNMGKKVAIAWHSEIESIERVHFERNIKGAAMFYCSPECIVNTDILTRILKYRSVRRIVVDEGHYILSWGDHFRPAFRMLKGTIAPILPNVHWLVLTATATSETLGAITASLGNDFKLIQHNPIKSNIDYHRISMQEYKPSLKEMIAMQRCGATYDNGRFRKDTLAMLNTIKPYLNYPEVKSLVFCGSRRRVDDFVLLLEERGINARSYHAGMSSKDKQENSDWFSESKCGVMVATNAFGVGVDIPDIRNVFHVETPLNVDAYLQESGRAGRDGAKANAYYLMSDIVHKAGNALISMSYPSVHIISEVMQYLNEWAAFSLNMPSINERVFGQPIRFSLAHMNEVIGHSNSILRSSLDHLQKSGFVSFEEMGETVFVLNQKHTFDLEHYKVLKEQKKYAFSLMKNYMTIGLGEEKSYLGSFYNGQCVD
nr:RecQ family ATP-dependent DNA helicase [Vibrio anguillarum]